MANKRQWSKMIDVDGISIRLHERTRGTTVYMSFAWEVLIILRARTTKISATAAMN